jgi:uncharacterized protein
VKNSIGIKVVFDCNILIQAAANSQNPASACFRLAESRAIELFVSEITLAELEEVLNRDYIKEYFRYTDEVIAEFLERVKDVGTIVLKVPQVFTLPRDVDDEIYVNLAVVTEADYIVTRDKDLIDLMTGFDFESKQFRQKFRPLKVVQPLDFLRIVEEKIKETIALKP